MALEVELEASVVFRARLGERLHDLLRVDMASFVLDRMVCIACWVLDGVAPVGASHLFSAIYYD